MLKQYKHATENSISHNDVFDFPILWKRITSQNRQNTNIAGAGDSKKILIFPKIQL